MSRTSTTDSACSSTPPRAGSPPFTVGWDVAGVVEQAGFGATGVREGDEVLGMPWFPRPANAYAEYVTAPSRHFVHLLASRSSTSRHGQLRR
jgi:NADPH:quinone reductase-like Zn-dependent oxidoreductase